MLRAVRVAIAILLVSAPSIGAVQFAEFENGKFLEILGGERLGDRARLTLPGGSEIAFPADSVVNLATLTPPVEQPESDAPEPISEATAVNPAPVDPSHWRRVAGRWADMFEEAAETHGLDPALLTAVARAESNLDPGAVSKKGACGLLQLMPTTARRFGVRSVFDPRQNIEGGARYLRWLLERYDHDYDLALAGYNAGEGAVDRHRGIPPFAETRRYVRRVLDGWKSFAIPQP